MIFNERVKQQRALADWLTKYDWQVFGTLKFTDGYSIGTHKAHALVRKFWNKLDRLYLGQKLIASGHRIERVVFEHLGSSGANLHYHFLANPDGDTLRFCDTARRVWDETSTFSMGYENTVIERARSAQKVSNYCLHEYSKLGTDTIFLEACHMSNANTPNEPMQELRRVPKQMDANEDKR